MYCKCIIEVSPKQICPYSLCDRKECQQKDKDNFKQGMERARKTIDDFNESIKNLPRNKLIKEENGTYTIYLEETQGITPLTISGILGFQIGFITPGRGHYTFYDKKTCRGMRMHRTMP